MSSANGRVRISVSLAVLAVLLAGLALSKGDSARAVTTVLTVNSYLDTNDGDCSPSPAGCTLRDAMGLASDPFFLGAPVIKFDPSVFPSNFSGPLIDPGTPYPVLLGDSNVTIDGTGAGVDIDGSGMSPGGDAFSIQTVPGSDLSNVTVRNLLVENFLGGAAISLCAGVQGAFTCVADVTGGVDIDGLTALHDRFGIWVGAAALTGVTITNSTFTRDGPSDPIGIYATREIANVSITNSTLTDDNDTPVRIDSLKSISGITLSNNNMTSTGFYVRANQGISNVTVQGNEIHDSSVEAGIRMDGRDGVSNVQVTGNTVANNTYYGVILIGESGPIEGVTIQDNTFTGNLSRGIQFSGDRGTAANSIKNNTIHDNGEEGIWVSTYSGASAPSVKITRNSTYANGRLGIDLNGYPNDAPDGVTPNDPGDADTGPNDLLNFPVITGSTPQAVTGTACASCKVELFLSDNDPSGYGEGQQFLADATADAATGAFSVSICGLALNVATKVTATATDTAGNTSEFSQNYILTAASGTCPTASPSPTHSPTPSPTPTPSPVPTAGARLQGDLDCDGAVTARDGLIPLLHKAGLPLISRQPDCPDLTAGAPDFADLNCDGSIDQFDGLAIVAYAAGARALPQTQPCTPIGQPA